MINFRAKIILTDYERYDNLVDGQKIYDPAFKGGLHADYYDLGIKSFQTNGRIIKRILKEKIHTEMCGVEIEANHNFFEVIENKIQQLVDCGLIDYYSKKWPDWLNFKRYSHLYPQDPEVLTLNILEVGFIIWLCSLLFAIIAFAMEWLIRIREYIVMKYVLHVIIHTQRADWYTEN